jgi:lysylphosphatidylglycerol synthetase-like protein (DUF2156 family)
MNIFMGINFLAVFVAAVVATIIGAVWFGPKTFFPVWWKTLGKTPDQQPGSSNMAYVFGMTFLGVLAMVFGLAFVMQLSEAASGPMSWANGAFFGALIGLLIGGGASMSHRMFSGQGFKIWALEVGNDVVALAAAGAILALWN